MSLRKEVRAFDDLPKELRDILNYTGEYLDPRYIFGMYKTQGLRDIINYLDAIGMLPMENTCCGTVYG